MSGREKWRYVHALNIYQIALLSEGYDPSEFNCSSPHHWSSEIQAETTPILTALRNAIEDEALRPSRYVYCEGFGDRSLDYEHSLVRVEDLRIWIAHTGFPDTFFCPAKPEPSIEDRLSDFYAPKLAAAIAAWKAVTADPRLLRGKSPKKAIEAWLRENAAHYELLNKDGSPNATGIEEIAKVANWKPAGGAPATPELDEPTPEFGKSPGPVSKNSPGGFDLAVDEEIPF